MLRLQLVGLALYSAMLPACILDRTEDDLEQLLRDNGFTLLTPPNQIDGPGEVITIDDKGQKNSLVCTITESVGPDFRASISPTTSITFKSGSNGSVSITGKLYKYLTADVDAKLVASLKASLTNAYVIETSEAHIKDTSQGNRTPGCTAAITDDQTLGLKVANITTVYKADYDIEISYTAGADANIQLQISDKLALKLGASATIMSVNQITGTGLFWGFKSAALLNAREN